MAVCYLFNPAGYAPDIIVPDTTILDKTVATNFTRYGKITPPPPTMLKPEVLILVT